MILVGLTGTHGAGKGTITTYLCTTHNFVRFSVSEFLAAEAVRRGRTPDRHVRHDIANEYRAKGPTALMEAVFATVDPNSERVVLEPQYTVEEVQFIKNKGGTVIAVDAPLEVRYARVHVRGSTKDDVSFEDFKRAQEVEMQAVREGEQNLSAAIALADEHIVNDGTQEELYAKVQHIVQALVVT